MILNSERQIARETEMAGEFGEKIVHEVTRHPWRLGLLYSDAEDRRLIVPNRLHLGWTLNFGRRAAWVLLAGLIAAFGVTRLARHS